MGRKKRPAAAMAQPTPYPHPAAAHAHAPPPHRPYGAPPPGYGIPPPNMHMNMNMNTMPPVPVPHNNNYSHAHAHAPPLPPPTLLAPPLPPPQKIESFTVKKYRPSKHFRCIDAFQRYTKSHRMTDASFTQITPTNRGATLSCPIVFSCKIGGSDLSWGRGKTRDVAIDNACRAAFALVAAHGYTDFDCNEDCLTVEPMQLLVESNVNVNGNGGGTGTGVSEIPLPPPPLGGVLPPPPMGMMMNVPPPPLPPQQQGVTLIPQGMSLSNQVAVPSVIKKDSNMNMGMNMSFNNGGGEQSGGGGKIGSISLSYKSGDKGGKVDTDSTLQQTTFEKKIKGGLVLLYDTEADGDGVVVTMEMRRARLSKYREVLQQCWEKQRALLAVQGN